MNKERVKSLIIEMRSHAIQFGRLQMKNQSDFKNEIEMDTCHNIIEKFMNQIFEEIDR